MLTAQERYEKNLSELEDLRKYCQMVGKKVTKMRKGGDKAAKPFKSKLTINTVKDIINHPILNIPAFTFEEDDSYVECRRCHVVNDLDNEPSWLVKGLTDTYLNEQRN